MTMSDLTHAASGTIRTLETAPLGALLVSRGFLSEAELSEALAEQDEAPRPLGAILVDRGLVRPGVVAQALATQHGSILKTEYGFATGFDARLAPEAMAAEIPVSSAAVGPSASLRLDVGYASPSAPPEPAEASADSPVELSRLEAVELELATAAAENEKLRVRLGEMQLDAMQLRSESEVRRKEAIVVGARAAGLEAAIAALYEERDQLRVRVDELQRRVAVGVFDSP
jgi:hypothetical protein